MLLAGFNGYNDQFEPIGVTPFFIDYSVDLVLTSNYTPLQKCDLRGPKLTVLPPSSQTFMASFKLISYSSNISIKRGLS